MTSQIRRSPSAAQERPRATLSYGDEFGPYIITGFAGCGATSYVYKARRRDRFEPVAIKVLHPHLVADSTRRLRFYREARIMMRMEHPNVVRFEEIIEEGDTLAFVMEYVDGVTLQKWRQQCGTEIDEMTLACVFVDILRGVTAAHREGVIHRDLKPGNVLIEQREDRCIAKIIDFGVARFVDEPLTEHEKSKIIGTAAYVSPEEVGKPEAVFRASDLYSIGVMLYEAACGQRPFEEQDMRELLQAHVRRNPQRPTRVNPGLSRGFEEVILRTLDKRPGQRFSSAPEMIGALECALHQAHQGSASVSRSADFDPEEQVKTAQWARPRAGDSQGDQPPSFGRFFKRCLRAALVAMTSTGAEGGDNRHYLNRSSSQGMPFR